MEKEGLLQFWMEALPFIKQAQPYDSVNFIACAVPIYDKQDEICGAIVFTESVERYDTMKVLARNLSAGIGDLASTSRHGSSGQYISCRIRSNGLKSLT
ncbi:hypothetical protein [Pelosinus baikalensis]|uniref:Uncharacterized protein n=1 Tax=Pelosinus baikalensis TaxID=2892015 RepID=A0ABS8HU28_9FIRM|nr:hypothetical protein [Pelosinus baikalensis]MCC5466668.1 hypothetical protein [Pelosinus baikalensis]